MTRGKLAVGLAVTLAAVLIGGIVIAVGGVQSVNRTHITAYFTNGTGIFVGDDVRILGVRVGEVESIDAQPDQVKMTFWVEGEYKVPADAKAVILSPSLVSARAIQLVPAYEAGPVMQNQAVIPMQRTAVPVEWDDLRAQLSKLVETLQPSEPGGVSTLGAFVNTAADNLRGQGVDIHNTIVKLSQAVSVLGDHSGDVFGTINNLSLVVSALQDSRDVMRQLNRNLAGTTALLANQPNEVGQAVADLHSAIDDVVSFTAENREPIGIASDKLASVSAALRESTEDLKQTLHTAPTLLANFTNMYPPAVGGFSGIFSLNNFANPIQFICGAIEAASRLGAEQAAKLCVQYLAPIVKNRQYNFPPLGFNPVVGAMARPNEITYSEDWLRPDYIPPAGQGPPGSQAPSAVPQPAGPGPLPAEASAAPVSGATDLQDMLIPPGGRS